MDYLFFRLNWHFHKIDHFCESYSFLIANIVVVVGLLLLVIGVSLLVIVRVVTLFNWQIIFVLDDDCISYEPIGSSHNYTLQEQAVRY